VQLKHVATAAAPEAEEKAPALHSVQAAAAGAPEPVE